MTARYLARRALQTVFVVWAAFTATFIVLYAMPSDPVSIMAGPDNYVDPAKLAALRAQYGLDQTIFVQYFKQLGNLVIGNLGTSIQTGIPVEKSLAQALPETLKLTSLALLFALVFGVLIATLATVVRSPRLRNLLLTLPPLGVSIPGFWIGLMLLWAFSFTFQIFPAMGNEGLKSLILPAITLAVPASAGIAQILASGLSETWKQPYVHTAEAKGLGRWRIQFAHALRNAAIPAVTIIGTTVGGLLGGSVVAETVFARNGIGRLTQLAVTSQDIPVVQGVVVLSAAIYAVINLIVDLIYPLLDPRIRSAANRDSSSKRKSRATELVKS